MEAPHYLRGLLDPKKFDIKFPSEIETGLTSEQLRAYYEVSLVGKLPFELIQMIFNHLTLKDLGKISLTCKLWCNLTNNIEFLRLFKQNLNGYPSSIRKVNDRLKALNLGQLVMPPHSLLKLVSENEIKVIIPRIEVPNIEHFLIRELTTLEKIMAYLANFFKRN